MSTNTQGGVQLAIRVDQDLYAKILERKRAAEKKTGIRSSVSSVARAMLEEAAGGKRAARG